MVCVPACEGSVLGSSPMSVIVGWKKVSRIILILIMYHV